ncbi:MAG: hypothetical protein QM526_01080 [Alphaproteobacteria bacterium]|nr:hypothetical protein [Alphaproteobacteria bacterium]
MTIDFSIFDFFLQIYNFFAMGPEQVLQHIAGLNPLIIAIVLALFGEIGMHVGGIFFAKYDLSVVVLLSVVIFFGYVYDLFVFVLIRYILKKSKFVHDHIDEHRVINQLQDFFKKKINSGFLYEIFFLVIMKVIPGSRLLFVVYPLVSSITLRHFTVLNLFATVITSGSFVLSGYIIGKGLIEYTSFSSSVFLYMLVLVVVVAFIVPGFILKYIQKKS